MGIYKPPVPDGGVELASNRRPFVVVDEVHPAPVADFELQNTGWGDRGTAVLAVGGDAEIPEQLLLRRRLTSD
ncbi:hypothetical protein ES708_34738 [subsurface metagenome]